MNTRPARTGTPRLARVALPVFVAGLTAAATAQTRYTVVDPGIQWQTQPVSLNRAARTTGSYFNDIGQRRSFLWAGGPALDLGTLGGVAQSAAISDTGIIVGYSVDTQNRQRAFRYQAGVMTDLGTLHNGVHAAANDVNSAGWIAGMSFRQFGNDSWQRAALWRNGTVQDLGTFGGEYAEALAINDAGKVVGWAWTPLPTRYNRAFLWSDATGLIDLGTLGGVSATATDINDLGAVVGSAATAGPQFSPHPFLWTASAGMTDLGTPPGTSEAHASAINNAGQVIGGTFLVPECRFEPLLWQNGQIVLLNQALEPGSPWTIGSAIDINDSGIIAATARQGTAPYRTVLLVPRPPVPSSATPARR